MKNVCKYLCIFTHNYFLKWFQTTCCWVRWTQISARNYIYNAVCEECLHISLYIYPLFSQLVSQTTCCWRMINSDFSEKSFLMLYVKNVSKYLFIVTPYFFKWCHLIFSNGVSKHVVEYDKFLFQREIICNVVCGECLQISIYIYPLFSQLVKNDILLSMINSDFSL